MAGDSLWEGLQQPVPVQRGLWDGLYDPGTGMPYPGNAPDYGDLSQRMTNAQQRIAAGLYEAGAMPGRAFGTVPGGPPSPEEEANWGAGTALGMLGAARLPGGAPAGAVGAGGGRLIQPYVHTGEIANPGESFRAYHSSPYTFTKFDPSMIGTGEGAQMYGHGFYFAENPAVSGQGGQYWNSFVDRFPPHETDAARLLKQAAFDRDKAIALAQQKVESTRATIAGGSENAFALPMAQAFLPRDQAALDLLKSRQPIIGPRTYEVNINARPEQMLNWDAPLTKQPGIWDRIDPNVRNAIDNMLEEKGVNVMSDVPEAYTGRGLYKALSHYDVNESLPAELPGSSWYSGHTTEPQHTSAYLNSLGIPGIRYLDQGSRNAQLALSKSRNPQDLVVPDPTHNYVIFDPNKLDIRKMYAVPGAAGAGAAATGSMWDSLFPQREEQ